MRIGYYINLRKVTYNEAREIPRSYLPSLASDYTYLATESPEPSDSIVS